LAWPQNRNNIFIALFCYSPEIFGLAHSLGMD